MQLKPSEALAPVKKIFNVNVNKKPPITPPIPLTHFAAVNKAR